MRGNWRTKKAPVVRLASIVLAFLGWAALIIIVSNSAAATGWSIQTVDYATQQGGDLDELGLDTSLGFDIYDNPHISYYDEGSGDLKYATWEQYAGGAGHWLIQRVDTVGKVGKDTSIDASGTISISYYDETKGDLKFASKSPGGTWTTEVVDNGGGSKKSNATDVGEDTSLEIDASGKAHISYYDDTNGRLKYASFVGDGQGNCGGSAKRWKCEVIDSGGVGEKHGVGKYTSLALDASGNAHISYYDADNGDLKYAHQVNSGGNCGSGKWQCETIDTGNGNDVGEHTSIALLGGLPQIAYEDETLGDLKYACLSASGWQIQVVADQGHTGEDSSLVIGSDGRPRISFHDETNEDLDFAMRTDVCGVPGTWEIEAVDTVGKVGEDSSLALKSDGTPCISYHDETNGNLKYACKSTTEPPSVSNVQPSGWINTTSTTISADYTDHSGSGINLASVAVYLDAAPLSDCTKTETHVSCFVSGLSEGHHDITVSVSDNTGNSGTGNGTFEVCLPVKPDLELICPGSGDVRWASLCDYQLRLLSVNYTISNLGGNSAYNVAITDSVASSDVALVTPMPYAAGNIPVSGSTTVTLKYFIPPNVGAFSTVTSGRAEDSCGGTYTYPN